MYEVIDNIACESEEVCYSNQRPGIVWKTVPYLKMAILLSNVIYSFIFRFKANVKFSLKWNYSEIQLGLEYDGQFIVTLGTNKNGH